MLLIKKSLSARVDHPGTSSTRRLIFSRCVLGVLIILILPLLGRSQSQTLKYQWRKISGPSQYRIISPNSATTDVTDLAVGIYKFELKVTNSRGLSARDTMTLTVNPPDPDKNSYAAKIANVRLSSPIASRNR